jgi:beta-lactamase class A
LGGLAELPILVEAKAREVIADGERLRASIHAEGCRPQAVTAVARRLGEPVTRLDRNEPFLNEVPVGQVRDTSPASIAHDVQALLVDGAVLSESSRALLTKWMVGNTTGKERLRAGLPDDWRVGDKTGTGPHGATNDVAIVWPPGRAPVIISAFFWGSNAPQADLNRALADVARIETGR